MDNNSAGAVMCCDSNMGYAHVARLTGQQQKDEDSGPRLEEEMADTYNHNKLLNVMSRSRIIVLA